MVSCLFLLTLFDFRETWFCALFRVWNHLANSIGDVYYVSLLKVKVRICQIRRHFFRIALIRIIFYGILFWILGILGVDLRYFIHSSKFLIYLFNPSKLCASSNCPVSEDDVGSLFNSNQVQKLFFLHALAVGVVNRAACFIHLSSSKSQKYLVVSEKVWAV